MNKPEQVMAYKYNNKLYETREELNKERQHEELESLLKNDYLEIARSSGFNFYDMLNLILSHKDQLLLILSKY